MVASIHLPGGSEKSSEFKRYQQALAVFYITVIGAGTLILAASVVRELLFRPVVQPRPDVSETWETQPAIDPSRLLQCHQEVSALYQQLAERANQLLQPPLRHHERELLSAWESFAQTWRRQWETVSGWCGFSQPQETGISDTAQGEAYDRLADVHAKLFALELKYRSLLTRFEDELAADHVELQRALDRSRRLLVGAAPQQEREQGASHEKAR
jgi:hypothetical protein